MDAEDRGLSLPIVVSPANGSFAQSHAGRNVASATEPALHLMKDRREWFITRDTNRHSQTPHHVFVQNGLKIVLPKHPVEIR